MSAVVERKAENCRHDLRRAAAGSVAPRGEPDDIATFAHEVRNILSPLSTSSDLLNLPGVDEATQHRCKSVIGRQVRQLRRLVNDLLDAHRLDRQEIHLALHLTNLTEAVEAICDDHRGVFAAQGIALVADVTADPVWIMVDLDRIDQALNNLLSNSLKFTDRGGSVCVALAMDSENRQAIISVRDTGVGIEPAVIDAIFDPHAHESSYRNRSGLGLGLPLAKRLVELHGGRLEASSKGAGKGAEFRISLPLPEQQRLKAVAR